MFYIITSLSLVAVASSIYMAGLVYFTNTKALLNRVFAILCLSIAWWAFAEFQARTAATEAQATFWLHAQLWPLSSVLFLHFALIFTGRVRLNRNWLLYLPLYGSALAITLIDLFTSYITVAPVQSDWGWHYQYTNISSAVIAPTYVGVLALIALYFVFAEYRTQEDPLLKKQAKLALAGFSLPVITGIFFSIVFPVMGLYAPELTTDAFGIGSAIFIGVAVWRYQLFRESPAVLPDAITAAPDALFILNEKGIITSVNMAMVELLGYEEEELKQKGIESLFLEDINLWRFLLVDTQDEVQKLETKLRKKDGSLVRVSISAIKTMSAAGKRESVCIASNLTARLTVADALEKSEQRYRRLVETSPDAIAVADLKTTIIMANQQAAEFYGADTPDEMIGKNFLKILAPGQRLSAIASIRRTISEGTIKNIEYTFIKKDGNRFPGELSASVLKGSFGRPIGFIASVRDLTERKQAEREINEKRDDLQLINSLNEAANRGQSLDELFEMISDSMRSSFLSSTAAIYLPVDGGRKLTLQGEPISYGKKKKIEAIIRRPISDFTTIELKPGSKHLKLLENGSPTMINDLPAITELVAEFAPNETLKKLVPAVMKIMGMNASMCVPLVFRGQAMGMVIISRKLPFTQRELERVSTISEQLISLLQRQRIEKKLRESEELHRSLIETSPDNIAMVDMDGKMIMANERSAQMHGYESPEELLGISFTDLISPEDRKRAALALAEISNTGVMRNLEINILRKDGGVSPAEINASLLRDEGGAPIALVGIIRDITERKKAEEQIIRQQADLETRNSELAALYSISSAVSAGMDLQNLLDQALKAINKIGLRKLEQNSAIFIKEDSRLRLAAQAGSNGHIAPCHENLELGQCLCGHVVKTGKLLVSANSDDDRRHAFHDPQLGAHGHVIVPLKIKNETIGALCLYYPPGLQFEASDLNLLMTIGNQLALAIENINLYAQTRELSLHDHLTGLANRRLLDIKLDENFLRAKRMNRPLSLIMIDLDHFKQFNDTYGHLAGDRLLKDVAAGIKSCIRAMDFVCRFGGEEFLLIVPEAGEDEAYQTAERIRQKIKGLEFYPQPGKPPSGITVSLGLASNDKSVLSREDLIARADMSLYRAKQNGRNRTERWQASYELRPPGHQLSS